MKDGGKIVISVRVSSVLPISFIEKNLTGPNGNIYSGVFEELFDLSEDGQWVYEWEEDFSAFAASGVYAFTRLRVRNDNDEWSEFWPVETFFLEN